MSKEASPISSRLHPQVRKSLVNRSKIQIHSIDGRAMLARSAADSMASSVAGSLYRGGTHLPTTSEDPAAGSSFPGTNDSQMIGSMTNGQKIRMQLPKIQLPASLMTASRGKRAHFNRASATGHSMLREIVTASTGRRQGSALMMKHQEGNTERVVTAGNQLKNQVEFAS